MFRGIHAINLDSKGRLAVPRRYRERLVAEAGNQVVVTIDTEAPCLMLYPMTEWEHIEQKLQSLPSFNKAARRLQRLLIGHATEVELDANGRVLLSPVLRDYAKLSKKIMMVGQGRRFELWDETTWVSHRDNWLAEEVKEKGVLPPEMESLSI